MAKTKALATARLGEKAALAHLGQTKSAQLTLGQPPGTNPNRTAMHPIWGVHPIVHRGNNG
jgi:hypothetical protein